MAVRSHARARLRFAAGTGRIALLAAGLGWAASAEAQAVPQTGPTREEILRNEPARTNPDGTPAIDARSAFARSPCPLADPQFANVRLTISGVTFAGAENVEPGLLDAAWEGLRGKDIPVASICDIRDRAAEILRLNGYVASVQVPVQTIEQGAVRFDVIVARLVSFVVRGDTASAGPVVERYLAPLREQPVFDTRRAERALLLARRIPGLDVRMTLARASGEDARPGDLVGLVDVVERRVEGDVAGQNFGSDAVGQWGAQARVRINGLTGLGDQTELSVFATPELREQRVIAGRHEFALGANGLRMGVDATYAWTRPDVPGPDDFHARTLVGSLYATFPALLTQARVLDLRGEIDLVNQRISFTGVPFTSDRLRVLAFAADYREIDSASVVGGNGFSISEPRWSDRLTLELRKGLAILDASTPCGAGLVLCSGAGVVPISRLDANPQGFVVRGAAEVTVRPRRGIALTARPRFQYSDDRLLAFEQFSGGNFTIGRGFDPGAATGDRGFGGQFEAAIGSLEPRTPDGSALQQVVFLDSFAGWFTGIKGVNRLTSVGGGLRLNFKRRAYAEVLAAKPLTTAPLATREGNLRILVNIAIRLGP